jgi:hypothetical protein
MIAPPLEEPFYIQTQAISGVRPVGLLSSQV